MKQKIKNFRDNSLKIALIILMAGIGFACSKLSEDSGSESLEVSVSPKQAVILPLDDQVKCGSTTKLAPNFLEFSSVSLAWSSASSFKLISMTLELKSSLLSGGKYPCPIAGTELIALMPTRTIDADTTGATRTLTSSSSCSLRCGGIKFVTGATSATIPGKIKILAIETDAAGDVFPITKEADVTAIYKAF